MCTMIISLFRCFRVTCTQFLFMKYKQMLDTTMPISIINPNKQVWLKYNDIAVTKSSWEELERDSHGGLSNVSAYFLMYINNKLPHFNADSTASKTNQVLGELEALSVDHKPYIQEDNWRFEQEVEE